MAAKADGARVHVLRRCGLHLPALVAAIENHVLFPAIKRRFEHGEVSLRSYGERVGSSYFPFPEEVHDPAIEHLDSTFIARMSCCAHLRPPR